MDGSRYTDLAQGWEMTLTPAGQALSPDALPEEASWLAASVPGTAAAALRAAGQWDATPPLPLHERDVWYRLPMPPHGDGRLVFEGLATQTEIWLDGTCRLQSESMFVAQELPLTASQGGILHLCFRALRPGRSDPAAPRPRRPRWRAPMIAASWLRERRATILGQVPGWCPPGDVAGPWRPVRLIETGPIDPLRADLRCGVTEDGPWASLRLTLRAPSPITAPAFFNVADARVPLTWEDDRTLTGRIVLPGAALWWPHTHGIPALHAARAEIDGLTLDLGRVGFRTIELDRGADGRGFALRVNGTPVFCRGACWITPDPLALPGTAEAYAPRLELARQAGMNMLRVTGTGVYESGEFHALCDEMGIMVWQDFMFANFDYPAEDPAFAALVRAEATQVLDRLGASPSLAVLCGGSEVSQQAAMMGRPIVDCSPMLFETLLADLCAETLPGTPYVTNSPSAPPGTTDSLPFSPSSGNGHYYGVGAYRRGMEDVRRTGVRFASECLAFANPPCEASLPTPSLTRALDSTSTQAEPGVARDAGADWDFADVRDHYLHTLYGVAPSLRRDDPQRYTTLARDVTGRLMEAVFTEWRRPNSGCGGGLILQLQDLAWGSGWGVIDVTGRPKPAWYALRRAFRPLQLGVTDEGLDGLAIHAINETAAPIPVRIEFACLRDGKIPICKAERELTLPARGGHTLSSATLIGGFFDVTYAYRFGPPEHDVTVVTMTRLDEPAEAVIAYHLPQGLVWRDPGLSLRLVPDGTEWALLLQAELFTPAVQIEAPGFRPEDYGFCLLPEQPRRIRLRPQAGAMGPPVGYAASIDTAMRLDFGSPAPATQEQDTYRISAT